MRTFIICHQEMPCFRIPADSYIIWLNSKPAPDIGSTPLINGYELMPDGESLHEKISGALGPMIIRRFVESQGIKTGSIAIWQYRKFVTSQQYGNESQNYHSTYTATIDQIKNEDLSPTPSEKQKFLISSPLITHNFYQQYCEHHHIVDLLKYTALAVELDVLTPNESYRFLNCTHLIIGGIELGTYPVVWWVKSMEMVERVSLAFAEKFDVYNKSDPYQKRAIAFCQERLGAYILLRTLKEASNNKIPKNIFGKVHTITLDGTYRTGK